MSEFVIGSVWKDRNGDYEITKNDGVNVKAQYLDSQNTKEFSMLDTELVLRIHNNMIAEQTCLSIVGPGAKRQKKKPVQYDLFRDYLKTYDYFDGSADLNLRQEFIKAIMTINKSKMNKFMGLFMDAKDNIFGKGVASGKGFEAMFSNLINRETDLFTNRLDLVNCKKTTTDILIAKTPKILSNIVANITVEDSGINYEVLRHSLGGSPFLEISLKEYQNKECQITTDYQLRSMCEELIGESATDNLDVIREITSALDSITDNNKLIMSCQFFPTEKRYSLYVYEGFQRIDTIRYAMKTKHSRYELLSKGNVVAHFKYGKNQANAYQRGLWINDLDFFTNIYTGDYESTTEYSDAMQIKLEELMNE